MDTRLIDIVKLARTGAQDTALQHLRAYIGAYPGDADAWVVLSGLAPEARIARAALRRALDIDPGHTLARQRLATLEASAGERTERGRPRPLSPADETPIPAEHAGEPPAVQSTATMERGRPRPLSPTDETPIPAEHAGEPPTVQVTDGDFQAVREARALTWPFSPRGTKHRPLGELLDERQITRQDLKWASAEAQNAKVRAAASTILGAIHNLPDVAMSLEEARLIAWPFRRLNRPLGELVDANTVRVKDLRRAAWFAKDARLREAARMLLPTAQAKRNAHKGRAKTRQRPRQKPTRQSVEPAAHGATGASQHVAAQTTRPMPVIQGSNYLADEVQRRYRRQAVIAAAAVVLLAMVLGILTLSATKALLAHKPPSVWLLPVIAALLLPLSWLWNRFAELRDEGRNFRRGQLGEIHVAQQLRHGLTSEWTLFRNVQLPGYNADIDMVLLGPSGIFALEVKAYTGDYRYRKADFYRKTRVGWRKMQHNPGKQARAGGGLLHNYIKETLNRDLWVEPHLVWVGPGGLQLRTPEVYVWYFDNLDQETARLRGQSPQLSTEDLAALSGLLRGLCSTLR